MSHAASSVPLRLSNGHVEVSLEQGWFVLIAHRSTALHTLEDARETMALVGKVRGAQRRPLLVDLTVAAKQTPEAQQYYVSDDSARHVTACALVTPNVLSRVIGNLYAAVARPDVPFEFFRSREEAISWLRKQPLAPSQ